MKLQRGPHQRSQAPDGPHCFPQEQQQRQETGGWVLAQPSSSWAGSPSFDLAPAEPMQT